MAETFVAPQYVQDFRCTCGDCPDDCCHGWRIWVEQPAYRRLKKAMAKTGEERDLFRRAIKRNRSAEKNAEHYAYLDMLEDGRCPFLLENGYCHVHATYGEACLSQVCTTYPRQVIRVGERLEMSLAVSCPEVARLCLQSRQALDVQEYPLDMHKEQSYPVVYDLPGKRAESYFQHFETIREVMLQLLVCREYPIASRLFFCAYFANRLQPFFHQAAKGDVVDQLASEIDRLAEPNFLAELNAQFQRLGGAEDLAISIVLPILLEKGRSSEAFLPLLLEVWNYYGVLGEDDKIQFPSNEKGEPDFSALIARYRQLRQSGEPYAQELEGYLENYCRNYWLREVYTESPNLLNHLQILFIRVAILRFLIFSHPKMESMQAEGFIELAIDVFYRFSRGLEHDRVFTEKIRTAMEDNQMQSLAHLVLFLKV